MPDWVVTTAFRGQDELNKTFNKMGKGADVFGRKATRAFKRASRNALSFKKIVGGILTAGALQRGLGLLRQGVDGVTVSFIQFDDAITAAAAKFDGIERGTKTFEELKKTARDVGATTEFTAAQAAEGLRFLAKAGFDTEFSMRSLKSFVDLATASELEFGRAADIATDAMTAFGLNAGTSEQKLKNLTRLNDVMSKAVNSANIDLEDFFETMKMAAPTAKQAGVSIEEFSAITAVVGGAGLKGSLGGTALRTSILALTGAIPKAKKELQKLGIEFEKQGKLRKPIEIFADLDKKMKTMTESQKLATLHLIFGRRAMGAAGISIDGATTSLDKMAKSLNDAGGNSQKMADLMRKSIGNRLKELQSAALEVGLKFIDSFEKKIPGGIDTVIKKIREFDVGHAIEEIKKIGNIVKTVFVEGRRFIEDYKGLLVGLGVVVAGIKIYPLITGIIALKAAMIKAGGVAAYFNGILAANPIGITILAVAGLTAGIVTLVQHWDDLGRSIKFWTKKIWGYLSDLKVNAFNPFIQIPNLIMDNWEGIKTFFKDLLGTVGGYFMKFGRGIEWVLQLPGKLMGKDMYAHRNPELPSAAGASSSGGGGMSFAPGTFESQTEVEAKRSIDFTGQLNIAGAPQGSTFESKTKGAPPIKTELLGVNP